MIIANDISFLNANCLCTRSDTAALSGLFTLPDTECYEKYSKHAFSFCIFLSIIKKASFLQAAVAETL